MTAVDYLWTLNDYLVTQEYNLFEPMDLNIFNLNNSSTLFFLFNFQSLMHLKKHKVGQVIILFISV